MSISLKLITFITLSIIVVIVAGSCLGVTLATILSTINQIGEAWATGTTHSVTLSISNYFANIQSELTSPSIFIQANDWTTPYDTFHAGKGNWTDFFIPFMLAASSRHKETSPTLGFIFTDYYWAHCSSIFNLKVKVFLREEHEYELFQA